MVVSILHRATGIALSLAGLAVLTWWLVALSKGPDAYATFDKASHHPLGIVVLAGHLTMDTGAAFELGVNKRFAVLTIIGSVVLTALLWAWLMGVRP
jgi:succinate dehydrogenase / fumarate reductase cytochrome b subunit